MKWSEIRNRVLFTLRHRRMERELAEEMQQHLELKARENVAAGMSAQQARYAAQRQMGNLTHLEEESREARGFPLLESLLHDVRYALRGLRKAPGFTAVAALTLALGIGASTAIFSIVNTVLLRPLPYPDSERIATIRTISPLFPDFQLGESKPDFDDMESGAHALQQLAMFFEAKSNMTGAGEPEQISVAQVSTKFFPLFGVAPTLGRGLQSEDEQRKSGDVVLLSHRFWKRRFEGDRNVIGRTITLEEKRYAVIGVLPDGFEFPHKTDAWMPLIMSPENASKRGNRYYGVLAKIRPHTGIPTVQAELDGLAARLSTQYPKDDAGIKFKLALLHEEVTGKAKSGLMLLLGAVGFLLLIACANVSNLVLSRGMRRQNEFAVRAALGASRLRILRQLLVESILLAAIGGVAGLVLAIYMIDAYKALAPANIARVSELHVEPAIALFALVISSLAGILCGLAPALHSSRPDLGRAFSERTATGEASVARAFSLRGFLVIAEIALALMLLDGSALMVQSLMRTFRVDAGFRTDHLLTAGLILPKNRYANEDARRLFIQRLLDALHANPQLREVAVSDSPALTDNLKMMAFEAGTLLPGDKTTTLQMRSVAPGYFETLRIRLISGRVFDTRDGKGSHKVIINESLARRYFAGENPVGKTLKFGPEPDDQSEIIGVVADTRDVQLRAQPRPQVYLSLFQNPDPSLHLFVRTETDPQSLGNELRKTIWTLDKDQPVNRVETMTEVISDSVAEPRFRAWLVTLFAAAGLVLTLVGIYGVISYSAGQRTREIGIRVALGAQPGSVLRLVLRQGVRLAIVGALAGVGGCLALTSLLKSQLYDIKPTDPGTLVCAAGLMLLVALAACYVPARRATRVDPLVALRHE